MRGDADLRQVREELGGAMPLVRTKRELSGLSGRVAMHHVQGSTPFGMAVGPRQVALNNQTMRVLHQRMPHEAQCRSGAG